MPSFVPDNFAQVRAPESGAIAAAMMRAIGDAAKYNNANPVLELGNAYFNAKRDERNAKAASDIFAGVAPENLDPNVLVSKFAQAALKTKNDMDKDKDASKRDWRRLELEELKLNNALRDKEDALIANALVGKLLYNRAVGGDDNAYAFLKSPETQALLNPVDPNTGLVDQTRLKRVEQIWSKLGPAVRDNKIDLRDIPDAAGNSILPGTIDSADLDELKQRATAQAIIAKVNASKEESKPWLKIGPDGKLVPKTVDDFAKMYRETYPDSAHNTVEELHKFIQKMSARMTAIGDAPNSEALAQAVVLGFDPFVNMKFGTTGSWNTDMAMDALYGAPKVINGKLMHDKSTRLDSVASYEADKQQQQAYTGIADTSSNIKALIVQYETAKASGNEPLARRLYNRIVEAKKVLKQNVGTLNKQYDLTI